MSQESKAEQMKAVAADLQAMTDTELADLRRQAGYRPVLGEGSLDADILFIGEAPGKKEAESGRPFVGASGKVLSELLDGIGLDRERVYITNVVKDRPPKNRDPRADEIARYTPLLQRQIAIIQSGVIATLGRFAMEFVIDLFDVDVDRPKISQVRGRVFTAQASYGAVAIVPLYHPAVALYNRSQRGNLEADFSTLRQFITG